MNANDIIDALGGTGEVAKTCQITTGAVSQWRNNGIPASRMMYFKLLRPEVFAAEGDQPDHSEAA